MKPTFARGVALLGLILILVGVNWSIAHKEAHLANGEIAYLKLRPADPRSLMQGDFMRLRFQMADNIFNALPKQSNPNFDWRRRHTVSAKDGYIIVKRDNQNIATFKSLYDKNHKLTGNELKMRYRIRNNRVKFATNAYFFQEGTAKTYEKAEYGQFRVDQDGELLLTALFDKDLHKLEPKKH